MSRRFAGEWLMPFIDRELPGLRAHVALGVALQLGARLSAKT